MLLSVVFIIVAVGLLYYGAEFSLEASEKVGNIIGLSPLAIGMLLIGFGTSLPEFFVGHIAGVRGEVGIALGSLVGSNIANLFLILGVSGLIAKLNTKGKSLSEHLFIHLLLGGALYFVLGSKELTVITTLPLIGVLIIYLIFIFKDFKRESTNEVVECGQEKMTLLFFKMIIGFIFLYIGGELLVKGGTDLGREVGIDTYIISSIFIAFGTSFPELVTAIMAAIKKKDTDIIVGNIIGSNLFNCAFILGTLGIYEFKITGNYKIEVFALIFGASFLILLNRIKKDIHLPTSVIFLAVYIGIVGYWLKLY